MRACSAVSPVSEGLSRHSCIGTRRAGESRSHRLRLHLAASARARLTSFWVVALLGACSPAEDERPGSDALAAIATPELPGPLTGCEVAVSGRAGGGWTWKWDWDPATRTLRTSDGSWSLRYDKLGRLIEDVRKQDNLRLMYGWEPNALVSRRFYHDGQLDPRLSFEQRVSDLTTRRVVEASGRSGSGEAWAQTVHYDDLGFATELLENGTSTHLVYTTAGRWVTATRPNRSSVTCSWSTNNQLESCAEDGSFNPLWPAEGAAADGTPDLTWRFSPSCTALFPIAGIPWFSLPEVAPLSECLKSTPPQRSPERCRSYSVTWSSNAPELVAGESQAASGSAWETCGESPCWMQRWGGFRFAVSSRPATFHCVSAEGTAQDSSEQALDFDLGPVTSDWTCEVFVSPPPAHNVLWHANSAEGVGAVRGSVPSPIRTAADFAQALASVCTTNPCVVKDGDAFEFRINRARRAQFRCVELSSDRSVERYDLTLNLGPITSDWECWINLDPVPLRRITWTSNRPADVSAFVWDRQTRAPALCSSNPCVVEYEDQFWFSTAGQKQARFYCTPSGQSLRRDERSTTLVLSPVTEDWTCEVTFDPPPRFSVAWQTSGNGRADGFVAAPGGQYQLCTSNPCWMNEGDRFAFTNPSNQGAQFDCWSQSGSKSEFTAQLNLGRIADSWTCSVKFPAPPAVTPPPAPAQKTVSWEVNTGVPLGSVRGNVPPGMGQCGVGSCRVNAGASVTITMPPGYHVYSATCVELGPPRPNVRVFDREVFTLPNVTTNWKCTLSLSTVI